MSIFQQKVHQSGNTTFEVYGVINLAVVIITAIIDRTLKEVGAVKPILSNHTNMHV